MLKIGVTSDLHGNLIDIEPCELLLISGDISPLNYQRSTLLMQDWLKYEFSDWVNSLPCEKVIFIAGNHECSFQGKTTDWIYENVYVPTNMKAIYLEDATYRYISNEPKLYTIHGTPACKIFGNWAFMYSDEKLREIYSEIPDECDILLTHDTPDIKGWYYGKYCSEGNLILTEAILNKQPRYVFTGHLHNTTKEMTKLGNSEVRNVSLLNDHYQISYNPLYLDIE